MLFLKRASKNINNQFKQLKTLNQAFEYILVYRKSKQALWAAPYGESTGKRKEGYWTSFWNNADRPTMRYELLGKKIERGQWKWSEKKAMEAVENYKEYVENYSDNYNLKEYWEFTGKKKKFIRRRGKSFPQYWVEPSETRLLDTNWMDIYVNDNKYKKYFDTPKSVRLLKRIIRASTGEDDIVLDCFAGSGTTGQAVLEVNMEDLSKRKFILVEINDYVKKITVERIKNLILEQSERIPPQNFGGNFNFYQL